MVSPIEYIPNFINNHQEIFDELWNNLNWEKRSEARIEYWTNIYGRDYTYDSFEGGRTYSSQPTHKRIEEVADRLEALLGFRYEACFLNGYEGKRNALGWHSDDDINIDHSRPIAVVTVGAGREINFMKKGDKSTKEELFLESGSLLLMLPGMQDTHLHKIPKAGFEAKSRISLTYRGLFA